MKQRISTLLGVGAGILTLIIAGCGPNGATATNTPPGISAPTSGQNGGQAGGSATPGQATAAPTVGATATPAPGGTTVPSLSCNAADEPLPGSYTTIVGTGSVTGTTFTQSAGQWFRDMYAVAAAVPTSSPSAAPTSGPTSSPQPTSTPGPPLYLYTGTYTLVNGATPDTTGCMFLITTQTGAPLDSGSPDNGEYDGAPQFASDVTTTPSGAGAIKSLSISNIGNGTGSGSFTLDNGETGTVTITARTAVASSSVLRKVKSAHRSSLHG